MYAQEVAAPRKIYFAQLSARMDPTGVEFGSDLHSCAHLNVSGSYPISLLLVKSTDIVAFQSDF
jgi:hypothetical protein